eukprot:CAMPEP_0201653678 /NCGR_PEP_ID=MMETSP0493-20130528/45107_1 /ASSEMBLY_ACC=CAM_ASM_000838 /TAXON_ID=420259 /ORGANISM="Thalassiosira gravida, Strain GMp14c1" /LENGTH=312 /DNA_ID=CAMNT_0048130217 /DNA_START=216 /DNA_END=1156 /DNA_ORIENTATION=+
MSDRAVEVISTRQQATSSTSRRLVVRRLTGDIDVRPGGAEDARLPPARSASSRPTRPPGEPRKFFAAEEDGATRPPRRPFVARIEEDAPAELRVGDSNAADPSEFAREPNLVAIAEIGRARRSPRESEGVAPAVAAADPSDEIPNERIRTRTRERCAIRGERADDCIHGTADGTKRDESSRLDAPSRRAVRRSRSSSTFRDACTGGMRRGRAYPSSHRGGEERGNRVEGTGEAEEGSVGRIPAGVRGLHWSLMAMFALFIGVFTLVMPWLGGDDIVYPPTPPPPARVVKENEVLTGESIEKDDSDDSNKKDR